MFITGKLSLRDKISHYVKRGGVKQTNKCIRGDVMSHSREKGGSNVILTKKPAPEAV